MGRLSRPGCDCAEGKEPFHDERQGAALRSAGWAVAGVIQYPEDEASVCSIIERCGSGGAIGLHAGSAASFSASLKNLSHKPIALVETHDGYILAVTYGFDAVRDAKHFQATLEQHLRGSGHRRVIADARQHDRSHPDANDSTWNWVANSSLLQRMATINASPNIGPARHRDPTRRRAAAATRRAAAHSACWRPNAAAGCRWAAIPGIGARRLEQKSEGEDAR